MKTYTIRYNDLVGSYYKTENKISKGLIIVGEGVPTMGDNGDFSGAEILTDAGYDVVIPDYYGFCRSNGEFTPENCIKTLIDTKNHFKHGIVKDVYYFEKIEVKYDNFIFLGVSFGGIVVPMLPKFDSDIKNIALIFPLLENSSLGNRGVPEETIEDFLNTIKLGFTNLYRGINLPAWEKMHTDKLGLTPTKNLELMKGKNIFLAHGKKDTCICYKKTQEYAENLKKLYPNQNIEYKQYDGGHDRFTKIPAYYDIIKWLEKIN